MSRALLSIVLVGGILALSAPARADPRLDEIVYAPWVQNGTFELEARQGSLLGGADRGAGTTVIEGEYGLNDRVSLALVGAVHNESGASSRLDSLGLESVIYLGRVPRAGVDAGLYVEYIHGLHGLADGVETKLLLGKQAGRFEGLVNLILERPVGPHADEHFASYGYAASATWRTWGRLRLGAEAFGDFGSDHGFLGRGRQGAYVGPQLKWETKPKAFPAEIEIDAGWLASVGADRHEANSQIKLQVEFERRF